MVFSIPMGKMERWAPPVELSRLEERLMKRLKRVRALFGFLRLHRHELFDDEFQEELEAMYRQTGAGESPHPPAQLCTAVLLQGYMGVSDAEAVELTIMDARWQMVLDCLGAEEPLFSQGALVAFRRRMLEHGMDKRLLERTVALGKKLGDTTGQQAVRKAIKVAIDSRPLAGAGKVEDTINLLGHAGRCVARMAAKVMGLTFKQVCERAGAPLLLAPSIKAGLDINWSDPKQKAGAIDMVECQISSLHDWAERNIIDVEESTIAEYLQAILQIKAQDIETGADGRAQMIRGVAPDRRVSIEDPEMRHGRKSKSKRFDGYKEHIAAEVGTGFIVACAVTPANRPEEEGAAPLVDDIVAQGLRIVELHIDRAYVNSPVVDDLIQQRCQVFAKPWAIRNSQPGMFTKAEFRIDTSAQTVTCPSGEVELFEPGTTVHFDPEACGACSLRAKCTSAASGRGRSISIAKDEERQKKFRSLQQSKSGRAKLRHRTMVEHSLAHIAARKGPTARYLGSAKNRFDLRRASSIRNLEVAQRAILIREQVRQAA